MNARPTRRVGVLGVLAILAALAVRVVIPPGYMPDPRPTALGLVICTGHGALILSRDKAPVAPHTMDGACAFAGAALELQVTAAPPIMPKTLAWRRSTAPIPRGHDGAGRTPASPLPPARGPPGGRFPIV